MKKRTPKFKISKYKKVGKEKYVNQDTGVKIKYN